MLDKILSWGIVPEFLIRLILRVYYEFRFRNLPKNLEDRQDYLNKFIEWMKSSLIATETDAANKQHYELPTEFFKLILGRYMKNSCGY